MTHDDVIRLARQVADPDTTDPLCGGDQRDLITLNLDEMVRFAALVAAAVAPVCGECGKSAPDMLTALEKCEALALSDDDPEDLLEEVRIAAHAAIALAKGEV